MKLSVLPFIMLTSCTSSPSTPAPSTPVPRMVSQTGEHEHEMANCPNAVEGASTELVILDDGVEMLITAEAPDARHEIERRADKHLRMDDPTGQAPRHTGLHGGPGSIGYCPVIHDTTMIAVRRLPEGVAVRLRALMPDAVEPLRDEVRSRLAGLHARR